jgi:transposase-like protein
MMLLVDTKVDVQYTYGGVGNMERIPNAVYTKELREEAVKMITEGGLKAPEVARRLSIPKSTITYWVRAAREGTLSRVGKTHFRRTERSRSAQAGSGRIENGT